MTPLELLAILAVVFAPPLILVIRLRNAERHRPEPWIVLARAFAWGATLGAALAIVFESLLRAPLAGRTIPWTVFPVMMVLVTPLVEELSKALGLRLIDDRHPEPEDGYIYGGAVGLGFAATENVIHVLDAFLLHGEQTAFATALYRGIVTVALHGAASAIAGYGIWRARYGREPFAAVTGVLAAIVLHMGYNALAAMSIAWATLLAAAVALVAYLRVMKRVQVLDDHGKNNFS